MLAPLIEQALADAGSFRAVISTRSASTADVRLESELIQLQQDFSAKPSRVHLTLRVQLMDVGTQRVLASHEFDQTEAASNDDPYAGVLAANRALTRLLVDLGDFCAAQVAPLGLRWDTK